VIHALAHPPSEALNVNVIPTVWNGKSMHRFGFIKQHPVLSFYVLTFAISWGGMIIAVGLGGMPRDPAQLATMIPVMVVAMLAGPAVASILLTGIAGGRVGYRDLLSRLIRWREPIGLYAAALLTAPLVLMTVPLALSLRFPNFVPHVLTESNKRSTLLMGFVVGLTAGLFEELGWTGFVIPRLRLRFDSFRTAAIVGVLWGAWHLPVNIVSCVTPSGALSVPSLLGTLLFSFGLLPAYRVLMVRVWDNTGSLLAAVLMHLTLTASNIILGPTATPGMMAITFNLALAAAMWIVAAASVVASRKHPPVHVLRG
jgi:membrane protease YdiL (CAAX protease family)